MELDDRSLHGIGTFYGIQGKLARFLSTSLQPIHHSLGPDVHVDLIYLACNVSLLSFHSDSLLSISVLIRY
jgi:hypothetical protein